MLGFMAGALANVGKFFANLGSQACVLFWLDEPEMPKTLIK
jgi:cyclic lactone autoinducer peptide